MSETFADIMKRLQQEQVEHWERLPLILQQCSLGHLVPLLVGASLATTPDVHIDVTVASLKADAHALILRYQPDHPGYELIVDIRLEEATEENRNVLLDAFKDAQFKIFSEPHSVSKFFALTQSQYRAAKAILEQESIDWSQY